MCKVIVIPNIGEIEKSNIIDKVTYYDNIIDLLKNEGTRNVYPHCNSMEECLLEYKSNNYQDKEGVIAIHIK